MLEPGEMVMFNNWTTLHARTSFVDGGPHPRHLLRLWLAVPDGRTVIRPLLERSASYNRVHEQVSKQ